MMKKSVKQRVYRWFGLWMAAGIVISCMMVSAEEPPAKEKKWIQLFNGKDLKGWVPKFSGMKVGENYKNTFRVEKGLLRVCYDQYDKWGGEFGHLFYTRSKFSHYLLRVEYRFVGEQVKGGPSWAWRNNGLMIHCESPDEMDLKQDFPTSLEVQLLGGPKGESKRTTANLCTPGTNVVMKDKLVKRHCNGSTSKTYRGDQWVTVEVEVQGDKIVRHIVEGKTVIEYEKPQLDPADKHAQALLKAGRKLLLADGYISLQAESHPTDFRKIELLPLD